jgi:hypothetical protein
MSIALEMVIIVATAVEAEMVAMEVMPSLVVPVTGMEVINA